MPGVKLVINGEYVTISGDVITIVDVTTVPSVYDHFPANVVYTGSNGARYNESGHVYTESTTGTFYDGLPNCIIGEMPKDIPAPLSDEELAVRLLGKRFACEGCGELWHETHLDQGKCPDCNEHGDLHPDKAPVPFVETFETMRVWGEEIFGPVSAERITERAGEEFFKELIPAAKHGFTPEATEEAADVVIILSRFPGLWEAIERKMQINRNRKWNLKGDGTGYHIPKGTAI